MAKISSIIKKEKYKIEITSPTGNLVIADEPIEMGGKDLGFSPKELMASSLAACTSATLRMYADRKEWDLQEVKIEIDLYFLPKENKTVINRRLEFIGNLDDAQKKRLLAIANACPVHKMLSNPIEINSQIENNLK
ncbi:OsmC family protein [Sphingobacterium sp. SGG-5]|uniref:OsmC family protein n=1 Tax=Sphingobacterium sp. SGG-5 TaxID=2710881 RepID=UPI0013ED7CAA|nr:OsmC family protein [Sphingobacterium sp. SGG-5]NGM61491.1 OsmC family protein [Sphingobacterium sp. SGG-5]